MAEERLLSLALPARRAGSVRLRILSQMDKSLDTKSSTLLPSLSLLSRLLSYLSPWSPHCGVVFNRFHLQVCIGPRTLPRTSGSWRICAGLGTKVGFWRRLPAAECFTSDICRYNSIFRVGTSATSVPRTNASSKLRGLNVIRL